MPRKIIDYKGDMDEFSTEGVHKDDLVKDTMNAMTPESQQEKLITFEKWFPILQRLGDPDDMTVEDILSRVSHLSVVKMVDLMLNGKSEKVQATCAKELAYMGGLKPVEKTQSVNVNVMARSEATSLLQSKLEKYGVEVVDGEIVNEDQEEAGIGDETGIGEDPKSFETTGKEEDPERKG